MALPLGTRQQRPDDDPDKKLTRFKRCHSPDESRTLSDSGVDPMGKLTRQPVRRHRVSPASQSEKEAQVAIQKANSYAASLHATDPISIDVLHRALPIRSATLPD